MSRVREFIAFSLFIVAVGLGLAGEPIWTAALAGGAVAGVAIAGQTSNREPYGSLGAGNVICAAQLANFAYAVLFSSASWAVGTGLRFAVLAGQGQ